MSVVDVVFHAGILTYASHADTMCSVAVDILYQNIGRVRLWAEAIISNIDPCITDGQSIYIV